MSLLQRMDRLVYATRLDRVVFRTVQPRALRWTPLLVLVALITGYVLMTKTVDRPDRTFFVGLLLFYGACLAAAFLRIFGPRFVPGPHHRLDERETMVKMRAYALSGILLTGLAMLGCFYFAGADVIGLWRPHAPNDWIALGFGIQAVAILLPTMMASWAEPRALSDPDD